MVRVYYTVKVFIVQNLYANKILLIVAFLFVKILNDWHSAFLVIFRWFYCGGTSRAAASRTWARGQHKYYGFPVLWTPKQTEKMPQFCPNYYRDLQKKKNFTKILTVFPVEIWWSSKKMFLGLTCWFLRVISMGLSRAHEPSAGLAEANGLAEAHGPAS